MGNTANLALPYPDNTDPLANAAAAIQSLAEAIDAMDTGWVATGVAGISYRVTMKSLVEVRFRVAGSWAAGAVVTLGAGAIPVNYRPAGDSVRGAAYPGAVATPGLVFVGTNGDVGLINTTGATRTAFNGHVVYMVGGI